MKSYKIFVTENFMETGKSKGHSHPYQEFGQDNSAMSHGHSHAIIRDDKGVATGFAESDGHTHSPAPKIGVDPNLPKETNT